MTMRNIHEKPRDTGRAGCERPRAPWRPPLAALVSFLAWACSGAQPPTTNVILISLDTTRADHLTLYGYPKPTDAHLKDFASRSRVFDVAIAPATWTLPSHVSMFSGLDPYEHGCWKHMEDVVDGAFPTVSPSTALVTGPLRRSGYHMVAAAGGPFTSSRYGLLRDFHELIEPDEESWELSADELNEWIFLALERRPADQPLFLFVNYFDAHAPYDAPRDREYPFVEFKELPAIASLQNRTTAEGPVTRRLLQDAIDQYDRELYVQDQALGALLDRLEEQGLLEDALVIVTADHGEMFGEKLDVFGHGCIPYEPVSNVPLVVHRSGGPVDRRPLPVSIANIPTTILRAVGLEDLPGNEDRFDLLALPEDAPEPYVEHRGGGQWVGVLRGPRYKLGCMIEAESMRPDLASTLFVDLIESPGEGRAATGPDADAAKARMQAELEARIAAWSPPPDDLPAAELTPAELEALNALGY